MGLQQGGGPAVPSSVEPRTILLEQKCLATRTLHAPHPGVHLSHPNFHLAPRPSAVALPVLPLLACSAQDRLPGRTRRESRPLYP